MGRPLSFEERIRHIAKAKGWTNHGNVSIRKLSDAAGISHGTLPHHFRRDPHAIVAPNLETGTLERLAAASGFSLEWIRTGEGPAQPTRSPAKATKEEPSARDALIERLVRGGTSLREASRAVDAAFDMSAIVQRDREWLTFVLRQDGFSEIEVAKSLGDTLDFQGPNQSVEQLVTNARGLAKDASDERNTRELRHDDITPRPKTRLGRGRR